MTSEKVPTEVAYEYHQSGPKCLWGFQILDNMSRHQWIKLGLGPSQKNGIRSRVPFAQSDCRNIPPPYHASSEDLATEYLRKLHEHTVEILNSKLGSTFDSMKLAYVITVPAVWSDKAKEKTLSCAERAGLGKMSKIRMISEPDVPPFKLCSQKTHMD